MSVSKFDRFVKKEGKLDSFRDIGNAYLNEKSCAEFVDVHAEVLREQIADQLRLSNFFSVLMDGSTIHRKDKELLYVNYFDKNKFINGGDPSHMSFLDLGEPEQVDADGLRTTMKKSLKTLDDMYKYEDLMK